MNSAMGIIISIYAVVLGIFAIIMIVVLINKRKKKNGNTSTKVKATNHIKPSYEVIDVEGILDGGVVTFNKGKSFSLIIEAFGNNYYETSFAQQGLTEQGYTNLFSYMQNPVQYCVQTHINRLDTTFEKYEREYAEMNEVKNNLGYEYIDIRNYLDGEFNGTDEEKAQHNARLLEIEVLLRAEEGKIASNRAVIQRVLELSNNRNYPKRRQVYILRHDYASDDFADVEMTERDILDRALIELEAQASTILQILRSAKVQAKILTEENQVLDVLRRHYKPRCGDFIRAVDIKDTNRGTIITTSTSNLDKKKLRSVANSV